MERGTPIAVLLAAAVLCRAGHEIDVLAYHEGADIAMPNLRLMRIRKPPLVSGVPIGFSWKKLVCDVWLAIAAYRRLHAGRYDVVHAVEESVFPALFMRSFFRFRLVYDMDSVMLDQLVAKWPWLERLRPILSCFERTALKGADLVLSVCPSMVDYARTLVPDCNVRLVPDVALPLPDVIPSDRRADVAEDLRNLFQRGAPLAVYVGNLETYQGIDLLLASFAALPPNVPCNLAVVGGPDAARRRYEALAADLGVSARVRFTGAKPLSCLPQVLAQADILCSPRVTGSNTPMKIYSYLASGRAILATDIESHTQVLDQHSAHLAAPTPGAFAAGLLRLAQDPQLRRRLGDYGARLARESYSFEAFSHRLLAAYETLEPRPTALARQSP